MSELPSLSLKLRTIDKVSGLPLGYKAPYLTANSFYQSFTNVLYFQKVGSPQPSKFIPKREKNDIRHFSNQSRLRALHLLNMVDPVNFHVPWFITLTYHNSYDIDPRIIKIDFDNFLKRWRRTFPLAKYFWRIELQKRGAPHYHLIVWFPISEPRPSVKTMLVSLNLIWTKYNNCNCQHCKSNSVRVSVVDDFRKAVYYVNKYLAKSQKNAAPEFLGRLWGNSRSLPLVVKYEGSGTEGFQRSLQQLAILYQFVYSKSNPDYLASLLWRPSMSLFIPSSVVGLLITAIQNKEIDPLSFVASKYPCIPRDPDLLSELGTVRNYLPLPTLFWEAPSAANNCSDISYTLFKECYLLYKKYISGNV